MSVSKGHRATEIRRFILENVDNHSSDIAKIAGEKFGLSRQAVSLHLRSLERQGMLVRTGKTRGTVYRSAERKEVLAVRGLREDEDYRDKVAPDLAGLPENVLQSCECAGTQKIN